MFKIGASELMVILFLVLIVVGPKNLPNIGKGFGKSISEFKKFSKDVSIKEELSLKDSANKKS